MSTLRWLSVLVCFVVSGEFVWSDDAEVVEQLLDKGDQLQRQDRFKESAPLHEKAVRIARTLPQEESNLLALALSQLAWDCHNLRRYVESEKLYRESLDIWKRLKKANHVANVSTNLANLLLELRKLDEAERLYVDALTIRTKLLGVNHLDLCSLLLNLSLACKLQGKYELAESHSRKSLEIMEAAYDRNDFRLVGPLHSLGSVLTKRAKYTEAEAAYQRAIRIADTRDPEHPAAVAARQDLAVLYALQHDSAKAAQLYQQVLASLEKKLDANHPRIGGLCHNLAEIRLDEGKFKEADALFEKAIRIFETAYSKEHPFVAQSSIGLGNSYRKQGRYLAAGKQYVRALKIYEEAYGDEHIELAPLYLSLGICSSNIGENDVAEECCRTSLKIREKHLGDNHPTVATSLNNLANLIRNEKPREAEAFYRRAIKIHEQTQGGPTLGITYPLLGLARLAEIGERYPEAEEYHRKVLNLYANRLAKENPDVLKVQQSLAQILAHRGNLEEAARVTTEARRNTRNYLLRELTGMSAAEQRLFLDVVEAAHFSDALSLAYRSPQEAGLLAASATWLLNGKAIGLEAQSLDIRTRREAGSEVLAQLANLRARQAKLAIEAQSSTANEAMVRQQADLATQRRRLEKDLARESATFAGFEAWQELADLQKAIPAGAVYVDITLLEPAHYGKHLPDDDPRYVAWVIPSGGGEIRLVDLGEAKAIDSAVRAVRTALDASSKILKTEGEIEAEKSVRVSLSRLAGLVLAPLRPHLDRFDRWIISPDGELWLAPWSALPLDRQTFAIEKHSVQLLVSGRDLLPRAKREIARSGPVILADPDYGNQRPAVAEGARSAAELPLGRIPRLPGTAAEVEAVREPFKAVFGKVPTVLTEAQATSAAFQALDRPRALLLATHGFFLPSPPVKSGTGSQSTPKVEDPLLRCGLLLAGCNKPGDAGPAGVLTGLEVLSADLRGCELVILSACETGLGDVRQGEGVAGLRQAFQLAGAESVLASLWKVPDEETSLQMVAFMDALAKGKDRVEALAIAQRQRIAQRRERFGAAHPFNWAAFTLTGNAGAGR